MLTLVAVLLHPPSALPLCYLLCCSLFILCSGKDLPWSHWCCLHKRQNSIWCKALWWRHHRMFFLRENTWKKEDDARMMMRRPASPPFHSMHHLASHWSQFAIERNQSGCLLDVWWKNPPWYANDLSQNLLIKRQAKMWFCMKWNISIEIEHSQKQMFWLFQNM